MRVPDFGCEPASFKPLFHRPRPQAQGYHSVFAIDEADSSKKAVIRQLIAEAIIKEDSITIHATLPRLGAGVKLASPRVVRNPRPSGRGGCQFVDDQAGCLFAATVRRKAKLSGAQP